MNCHTFCRHIRGSLLAAVRLSVCLQEPALSLSLTRDPNLVEAFFLALFAPRLSGSWTAFLCQHSRRLSLSVSLSSREISVSVPTARQSV